MTERGSRDMMPEGAGPIPPEREPPNLFGERGPIVVHPLTYAEYERDLGDVAWEFLTPEEKRQVNELAQALPDYPGGPWHGARKAGKSVTQQVLDRLGPFIGPERPSPVLERMRQVVQDELAAYDEMLEREESATTTFHAEPVVYWHRDDGASAFRPSETAAAPTEFLDITDLMNELWVRLVANIGLLAGVVSPVCFGWPPTARAVVRR